MRYKFIDSIMDFIFSNSYMFDKIRNIIQNNYEDEKKIISKNFDKNKKTLDFGCGAGQFSIMFNPTKYYGIDMDSRYIKFCEINRKGNFLTIKDLPPYNFNKKYFDQILVSAVIHHINNKKLISISKEFKRILKDKGKLIIIDHLTKKNQKNMICKILIDLDRGRYFRNPDKVINLFSRDFNVKKIKLFKDSIYKDYMLIFTKK